MAVAVIMPKQGNSVESCIITAWKKRVGDLVRTGDTLCEVETDKAMLEVTSPQDGTLLATFFAEGDDVPVLTNIAVIGQSGEDPASFRSGKGLSTPTSFPSQPLRQPPLPVTQKPDPGPGVPAIAASVPVQSRDGKSAISPRARSLAAAKVLPLTDVTGTGPEGRIIERDIQAALATRPALTAAAREITTREPCVSLPVTGSGVGGRITTKDLKTTEIAETHRSAPLNAPSDDNDFEIIPLKGVRKIIADRMRESLHSSAQLTLNTSADARSLQAYRQRLKTSPEALGLQMISINDLLLFALSRVLTDFPDVNAILQDSAITRYRNVQLGFAVDTPRGLLVPVIRQANHLSLKQLATEAKRLTEACQNGSITPDDLSGGTFTVSNLGALGIESFTPVINPPQVAILGVGKIDLKAVEVDHEVKFIPHLHLSLTIDHQVVDGAPGATILTGGDECFNWN